MFEPALLAGFLLAVLAVQLLPGPDMMLVVARGVGQGRKVALACVAGISAAGFIQVPALALGVASLFEQSPFAYLVLKYLGAVYLLYLGVRYLLAASKPEHTQSPALHSMRAAFTQGFISNLMNPKSWVFLLAFLPQFVVPEAGSVHWQLLFLGVIHKGVGILVDGSIAIFSGAAGDFLRSRPGLHAWQQRLVGVTFIAVGLRLALDERR